MKKLLYTLAFSFGIALIGFAGVGQANAQLVSPVPLDQVFPTVRDSSYGVPGNYDTQGFAFSFTQDIERCDCRGEFNNVGAAAIQMCLNDLGFTVSQSGHGAPGFETNCVGHKTQVALGSFQQYFGFDESRTNHYGEEDSPYAGMITQAIMNHLCYDIMNDNNKAAVDTTQTGMFTGRSGGSRNSVVVRDADPEPEGPSVSMPDEPLAPALVNTQVQSTVSATGANGCTGITYAILSTSPTSLFASIDANTGVVTVNPSAAGDWNVVVRATCSDGTFNDGTISGEATETQPDPSISMPDEDLGTNFVGIPVTSTVSATGLNGCTGIMYSIGTKNPTNLPATINASTGALTVTPNAAANPWTVQVIATCADGTTTDIGTISGVAEEVLACEPEVYNYLGGWDLERLVGVEAEAFAAPPAFDASTLVFDTGSLVYDPVPPLFLSGSWASTVTQYNSTAEVAGQNTDIYDGTLNSAAIITSNTPTGGVVSGVPSNTNFVDLSLNPLSTATASGGDAFISFGLDEWVADEEDASPAYLVKYPSSHVDFKSSVCEEDIYFEIKNSNGDEYLIQPFPNGNCSYGNDTTAPYGERLASRIPLPSDLIGMLTGNGSSIDDWSMRFFFEDPTGSKYGNDAGYKISTIWLTYQSELSCE